MQLSRNNRSTGYTLLEVLITMLVLAVGVLGAAGLQVTDEASAMELAGHPVQLVAGPARNFKVTVPEDLALAAWYLGQDAGDDPATD